MKFDHEKFFGGYRATWGGLSQPQVDGIESLLTSVEADPAVSDPRWVAYMLATVKLETGDRFQPIDEMGGAAYFERRYGYLTRIGKQLGNDAPGEGAEYHGRGDVQLTGERNYEADDADLLKEYPDLVTAFEARTGQKFDLANNPDQAKDPAIAYATMSYGMRYGIFTGKKLADYINDSGCDYFNSRRIINGTDRATLIASYAQNFETILNAAVAPEAVQPN